MTIEPARGLMAGASTIAMAALTKASPALVRGTSRPAVERPGIDESAITVTARRREERLIDVPAPINAVTPETLKDKGIDGAPRRSTVSPNCLF